MMFTKDVEWLDFHADPSSPKFKMPDGAVDAHCHVFGPGEIFPYSPSRKYTPCDASKEQLFNLHKLLGISNCVIVQASCHGDDNRALTDALKAAEGKARGVATVKRNVSDEELNSLHQAGVRGVRFNFVKRLVDSTPQDELKEIAERIAPLGWHIVVYFEAADLPELWDFLTSLPTDVVVDHMGRPDVSASVDGEEFKLFMKLMSEHKNFWCKVTCPERLSLTGPVAMEGETRPYQDVIPFARSMVENFPERVLWGTDWPHPNLKNHMPDDGLLADFVPLIAPTQELQEKLLICNPKRLYWQDQSKNET